MTATPAPMNMPATDSAGQTTLIARVGWVIVTLLTLGLDLYAIPTLYARAQVGCPDTVSCQNGLQLTASQVAQLHAQGVSLGAIGLYTALMATIPTLVCAALATLIFWRRASDGMALFCAYMLTLFGGVILGGGMQILQSASAALFILLVTLLIAGQVSWVVFFAVFPDGRFTPRWTLLVALAWGLPWVGMYFPHVAALDVLGALRNGPFLIVAVALAMIIAQVYRYRRVSNARQRQQTKWVVYGFAVGFGLFAAMVFAGNVIFDASAGETGQGQLTASAILTGLLLLIPVGMSVAILRSRLYEIDIIIRRTLIYGSLTAILAGVYFAGVVGAQTVVGKITGQAGEQQPVIIVLTTLMIAALFQPLRHGLQRIIDRRFYRGKYDAERALASFGAALRSEVDLDQLSQHLTGVVHEAIHPASVSLWLRPAERARGGDLTP